MDTTDPAAGLRLVAVAYGHPDAVALVERVQAEYVVRYGGPDETPIEPDDFSPPTGLFLVGYLGDEPVATGAWRSTGATALGDGEAATSAAEVKRMYVVPEQRRRGLASMVLRALETTAAEAGHDAVLLETGTEQPEAIALYTEAGYHPVPGFGMYAQHEGSRYYGRRLVPRA